MEPNDVEERIGRLEKELRHSRMLQRASSCIVLVLLVSSIAGPSEDVLRSRRVEIVDSQGRPRIVAEASPEPQLLFKSETGQDQIRLGIGGSDSFPFEQKHVPHLTLETGK